MEDVKRRLDLNDTIITQQTIRKIYDQISKNSKTVIDDSTQQSAELKLLWEKCGDVNLAVSNSCCLALLQLLQSQKAKFEYVLNGLLNAAPSAKNLSGIVQTVADILVLQLLVLYKENGMYINPYGMRNPPHPFITILTNRPDSWVLLIEQVHRVLMLKNHAVQECSMKLLAPFIKFVLLEPNMSPQFTQIRLTITSTCLKAISDDPLRKKSTVDFFLNLLPCLQVKTVGALGETTQYVSNLAQFLTANAALCTEESELTILISQLKILVNNILAIAGHWVEASLPSDNLIDILDDIQKGNSEVFESELLLPQLVYLLQNCPSSSKIKWFSLLDRCIDNVSKKSSYVNVNPLVLSMLYLPLLDVLTFSDSLFIDNVASLTKIAKRILLKVEALIRSVESQVEADYIFENINDLETTVCDDNSSLLLKICQMLSRTSSLQLEQWLISLENSLNNKFGNCNENNAGISNIIVGLVVGVFCAKQSFPVLKTCLKLFESIAVIDPPKSLSLLPVLLYKINHIVDPEFKLKILETLPNIATHKVSMAPILKTIQLLGGSAELKALSIRLVTSLWEKQDRVFPSLQQMLLEKDYSSGSMLEINQVILAKAASIMTICKTRPHQHGEDMVQPLSKILNRTSNEDSPAVSLALKGLFYLCESEVIDIRTAWSVLAMKLSKDNRVLAVRGICHLFSLVPKLTKEIPSYDKFAGEVLGMLWKYADGKSGEDSMIINSAYEALSKFTPETFKITHLPEVISKELIQAALAELPEEFEIDDSSLPPISGECYLRLLHTLDNSSIAGFEIFLNSLVKNEVKNIPRGIHHSIAQRQTLSGKQNSMVMAIPKFLLSQYEKNKQPVLRPGLAASLLFGYDPPIQFGRDGKPKKSFLSQFGRQYHQMLYTLINEVPIQQSEWHRTLLTPMAWTSFMDRCYIAYLEGRKAELQLELQQGKSESHEENQLQQDVAWLWARDKLTNLIKSCSRGSPASQGNSVCALVGLIVTTNKYIATLDKDQIKRAYEEAPEHMNQTHWTNMGTNSVLAIMDSNYQLTGRIFSMCQQRSEVDRTPASLLARVGAIQAISQLIPTLILTNCDLIYDILDLLCSRLPGACSSEEAGVVQFYSGIGTGSALAALFLEKFLDMSGMKGMLAVWKAVDMLEKSAFSEVDTRMGSILGLGMCLSAMCKDGKPDSKVRICSVQEQLGSLVEHLDKDNTIFEAACVSLACVTASGYAANILSQDIVDRTVACIYTNHIEMPHLKGPALALGMVCKGLQLSGHPSVQDLLEKLFGTWRSQLQDANILNLNKIAALHGASAISGADKFVLQIEETGNIKTSVTLDDFIKVVTDDLYQKSGDVGLQSCSPWLLGQLYYSSFCVTDSKSSVPSSYHYLPDTSIIKACTNLVIEASKRGPEKVNPACVKTVLHALTEGPNQTLPPLNWPALLSPLMRMSFGEEVEKLCLSLAIKQSESSPSAAMFISTWILSPLYDSLTKSSQLLIHESLPVLMRVIPPAQLEDYLNHSFLRYFKKSENIDVGSCKASIQNGLLRSILVNDPPKAVTLLLYNTLLTLYHSDAVEEHESLKVIVCKCLQHIPDNQVDKITQSDFKGCGEPISLHGLFTRCFLVGLGYQPLSWLNPAIESLVYAEKGDRELALELVAKVFFTTDLIKSESCSISCKMQWLLEIMGHIKDIASGRICIENVEIGEVIQFFIQVLACAVLAWSSLHMKYLFSTPSFIEANKSVHIIPKHSAKLSDSVEMALASALCDLLSYEPWKQVRPKVIDWLITMYDTSGFRNNTRMMNVVKGCLYSLRHSKDFNKINTWSAVYSLE